MGDMKSRMTWFPVACSWCSNWLSVTGGFPSRHVGRINDVCALFIWADFYCIFWNVVQVISNRSSKWWSVNWYQTSPRRINRWFVHRRATTSSLYGQIRIETVSTTSPGNRVRSASQKGFSNAVIYPYPYSKPFQLVVLELSLIFFNSAVVAQKKNGVTPPIGIDPRCPVAQWLRALSQAA